MTSPYMIRRSQPVLAEQGQTRGYLRDRDRNEVIMTPRGFRLTSDVMQTPFQMMSPSGILTSSTRRRSARRPGIVGRVGAANDHEVNTGHAPTTPRPSRVTRLGRGTMSGLPGVVCMSGVMTATNR